MTAHCFNDLLRKIHDGDTSAIEPIFSAYYKSMCNQAWWIVRSRQDAEDVASEAIIKIISYAQNTDRAAVKDAGAFVYTLVKNTALDFLRKNARTAPLDNDVPFEQNDGLDKIAVYDAMRTLSDIEFKIAEMFYYFDCKIKDIAEELDLTASAVKYHLCEIRKKLYKILKTD